VSRVDDDRQADLAAQRAALERRAEEQRKVERAKADVAFSQLINQQHSDRARTQESKSAVQALLEETEAKETQGEKEVSGFARAAESRDRARMATGRLTEKVQREGDTKGERSLGARAKAERFSEARGADESVGSVVEGQHQHDERVAGTKESGRGEDERRGEQGTEERDKAAQSGAAARAGARKGPLKADDASSGGGKGAGQGSQDQQGKPGAPAAFRLNPALMAPAPVARPRDMAGSARLRAVANEIAQKIVERVRVGENAAGKAEFQIDLRSNVLRGLSIKVSGSNGKISAVFSGRDKEVLKMLEEQAHTLKSALGGRGLTLAEFKVEELA
jgi:hypothetical protein